MLQELNCKDKVQEAADSRLDDLRQLWRAEQNGEEDVEDLGSFNEYGLCFDYVPGETFKDQDGNDTNDGGNPGYFRYQISYGGPSEEFRFYCDPDLEVYKIEFWYLDWFDGAKKILQGQDFKLMAEIFEDFKDCGTVQKVLEDSKQ